MKTHMKFLTKSKLGLATTASVLLASAQLVAAPLDVSGSVVTTTEVLGGDYRKITQTLEVTDPFDPETNADGITFTIDKALTAAGGLYPSSTIDSVKVTIGYRVEDITLSLTNNSGGTAGGSPGDLSATQNSWNTFTVGAITSDGLSQIGSGDFAGDLLTLDLSGGVASTETASAGPSTYDHEEVRNVASGFFGDYSGTGTFSNTFNTTIGIFSNVTGAGIDNSQSVGDVSFFMEVEYIVVPEISTLGMMGITIASAGGLLLYRRRKRA